MYLAPFFFCPCSLSGSVTASTFADEATKRMLYLNELYHMVEKGLY